METFVTFMFAFDWIIITRKSYMHFLSTRKRYNCRKINFFYSTHVSELRIKIWVIGKDFKIKNWVLLVLWWVAKTCKCTRWYFAVADKFYKSFEPVKTHLIFVLFCTEFCNEVMINLKNSLRLKLIENYYESKH